MGLLAVCGGLSCGPSFQAVYECDVRFEHCYALDQKAAPIEAKKQCWREWLHGYTYGQSGDRIEYAAARFSALSLDPTLPSVEAQNAKPPRGSASPVPTSAFAPPPTLAERPASNAQPPDGGRASSTREAVAVVRAPGSDCAEGCAASWKACHEGCGSAGCDECDRTYRACVPACFREEHAPPHGTTPAATPKAMR